MLMHPVMGLTQAASESPAAEGLQHALCEGMDARIFFPVSRMTEPEEVEDLRRLICGGCVANVVCRQFAAENKVAAGFWATESFYPPNPKRQQRTR